jgi:hypothetical protein
MIDLLYLAHNRLEFTKATVEALMANTDWSQIGRVLVYDDRSLDGTAEYLESVQFPADTQFRPGNYQSPVMVMVDYLCGIPRGRDSTFAKVDNDTMVPAGWLGECLKVLRQHPEVDLLGIEAFRPVAPGCVPRAADPAAHIGGIGLMRNRCFQTLPRPAQRFGFTEWQERAPWANRAWLNPALPVFLLDHLPVEPWASLTREYVARGWARQWEPYHQNQSELWDWWQPAAIAA